MPAAPRPALRALARLLAGAGVLAVAACQPVDSGVPEPGGEPAAEEAATEDGATLPTDLAALLAELSSIAAEWQVDPVVAEMLIDLDGEAWREATVTYLAPDADRLLVLQRDPGGTAQLRPTLETLDLQPVPAAALAAVPSVPADLLAPEGLIEAASEALDACDIDEVDGVLYTTGAPAAWDGATWTEPPAWTATVTDGDRSAVVDPVTGAPHPAGCLEGS